MLASPTRDGKTIGVPKVLGESAGCARALLANIASHSCVECISTNNLVNVGGWNLARLDQWVQALDTQSGASKSKRCLGRRNECESKSPLHVDVSMRSAYLGTRNKKRIFPSGELLRT